MEGIYTAIIKTDEKINDDLQRMQSNQRDSLQEFNKMLDAFYIDMESQ